MKKKLKKKTTEIIVDKKPVLATGGKVRLKRVKAVVFKLCAAALWGAVRNFKGCRKFFSSIKNIQVSLSKVG
jgi:hypothetical protein